MIERLLAALGRFAVRRPLAVMLAGVLPLAASLYALTVPLDLSFAGLMDRTQPEVARYFEASERYRLGNLLPVLLEGPEDRLDDAVADLILALDDLDAVESVSVGPPREWLMVHAPFLVDADTFDLWLDVAEGRGDDRAVDELAAKLKVLSARYDPDSTPGARLALVTMRSDAFELALDAQDFPTIRATAEAALEPLGVTARFAGMAAIITQEQEATLERLRWLGPLSLLLVLGVLRVVERRLVLLASLAVPMLLSVGSTLGIVGFASGELTIMESVFGVVVLGMGIDFGIHLLLRLREERALGRDFDTGVERAIAGTGRGIVSSAATTAGAFLILILAPDPVFARLGLAGGLGLVACLVLLLMMLPAEWALLERRRSGLAGSAEQPEQTEPGEEGTLGTIPGISRIAALSSRAPARVLSIVAVLLALSAWQIPKLHYETNLEQVFSRDIDAMDTAQVIHERFGMDPGPWLVAVPDLERAREVGARFEADPLFARADSLALFIPADLGRRVDALSSLAPDVARRVRAMEQQSRLHPASGEDTGEGMGTEAGRGGGAALEGLGSDPLRRRIELMTALLRADAFGPPDRGSLPEGLAERFIGPDGELLVYAFVKAPALDSAVAARERRAAQAIDPRATSMSAIYEALIGTDRPWMPRIVMLVGLFIAGVLLVDLRSVSLTVIALLPVIVASTVTLGVLALFGFSFNTVTLVGVPLLLGLGVDDGIHIVHRMLEQPEKEMPAVIDSVGRGIVMTTATTCASVVVLLLTRHPGLESVATLMLVGLPLCLVASITVLPAGVAAFGVRAAARRRLSEIHRSDLEK